MPELVHLQAGQPQLPSVHRCFLRSCTPIPILNVYDFLGANLYDILTHFDEHISPFSQPTQKFTIIARVKEQP